MKHIVVLLIIFLSSCTSNSTYTVMFEDGQIEEVNNTTGATFNKGDTLIINTYFGKSVFASRTVYGKYINSLPSYQQTYGGDSFLYMSVYNKAVVLK